MAEMTVGMREALQYADVYSAGEIAEIAAELAWLRENASVFERLDARQWAAVQDGGAVEDEGYEWEAS